MALFVIGLLLLVCLGILYKVGQTGSKQEKLLFLGVWAVLVFQTFINIGMNLGITPVTGIPLPLVSLGGSSLLAFSIMFGILTNVAGKDKLL